MEKTPVILDEAGDVVTIHGIKYSMEMFRFMAFSPTADGKWFRILKREDGVITVEVKKEKT